MENNGKALMRCRSISLVTGDGKLESVTKRVGARLAFVTEFRRTQPSRLKKEKAEAWDASAARLLRRYSSLAALLPSISWMTIPWLCWQLSSLVVVQLRMWEDAPQFAWALHECSFDFPKRTLYTFGPSSDFTAARSSALTAQLAFAPHPLMP